MAFVHGKNTKVLVNQYDLSNYLNNTDLTWEVDTPESTVYGLDDRTYIGGLKNSSMSFAGFFEASTTDAIDNIIPKDLGNATAKYVSYAPNGFTVGNRTYSVQSFYTSYGVTSPVDGIASINLDVQGTGTMGAGVSLHNLTAISSDGTTTGIDNSTSTTANGGVGYLHVTAANIPTGSLAITIQDSPSSSVGVWADLVSFSALVSSFPSAQRVSVSGSVDRYVRGEWAFTTTTTAYATFAMTFERL